MSGVTDVTENIWSARVDYRPNNNDQFFGRVNVQDSLVDGPLFVLQSRQFAGQRQYAPIVSGTFTGSWVRTLGSRWTNEAKLGINRVHLVLNQTDPNVGREELDANRSYPCTTINGVDIQLGCLQDIDRTNLGLEFIDNVSWFAGAHSVKFGVNFRRRSVNPFQAGYPNVTYNSLADFAANRIFQVTAETDGGPALTYGWQYDGYIQDDWRVTNRMTLNVGRALRARHRVQGKEQPVARLRYQHAAADRAGRADLRSGHQRLRPAASASRTTSSATATRSSAAATASTTSPTRSRASSATPSSPTSTSRRRSTRAPRRD